MGLKKKKKLILRLALGECFLENGMSGYIAGCSHSDV